MTGGEHVLIKQAVHNYGELPVLGELTLSLRQGEFVSIIGPSGCGKSTLLRILAGLLRPTSGSVTIDGTDRTGAPGMVGYLPQNDTLLPWRRALGNATVAAEIAGTGRSESEAKARALFAHFGLEGFEGAWPSELSGGMRQRVAVLRTFLGKQTVLALDEPFGALDALTRRSMQQWLHSVWREDPRTTLLVTHDVDEALLLSDRVLVMSRRPGILLQEVLLERRSRHDLDANSSALFNEDKASILRALGV